MPIDIDDPDANAVADYRLLRDADALRARGLVVAEGMDPVRWLLRSELRLHSLLATASACARLADEGLLPSETPCYRAERPVLSAILGFPMRRSVLALAQRPAARTAAELPAELAARPRWRGLLIDGVHDPANVGGLIRSARCLALDAVLLGPGCADPWYRQALRVSVGHVFQLQPIDCADPAALIGELRAAGVRCYAAHRAADALDSHALADDAPRWLLAVGNEDRGVQPTIAAACDARVAIPMAPGCDSLNVGVAAGILLHGLRAAESSP